MDAMIERDRDTNNDGVTDERLYVTQDANWNVTGLDQSWSATTDAYAFQFGHQGGKIDAVTGRINFRNRDYDVELMRWLEQDYKGGYVDGLNLYQDERSSPTNGTDPTGTQKIPNLFRFPWNEFVKWIQPRAQKKAALTALEHQLDVEQAVDNQCSGTFTTLPRTVAMALGFDTDKAERQFQDSVPGYTLAFDWNAPVDWIIHPELGEAQITVKLKVTVTGTPVAGGTPTTESRIVFAASETFYGEKYKKCPCKKPPTAK